jgi:hypothetical protein
MDELTLLRSVRSDTEGPTEEAANRTRALLAEAFDEEVRAHHPKTLRRVGWIGGFSVAAAAVVAVALLMGNVTGTVGGASASAAEILDRAAAHSPAAVDYRLQPGQFLAITTTTNSLFRVGPAGVGDPSGRDTAGWLEQSEDVLYVPADRSDDWTWVRDMSPSTPGDSAIAFFGTGAQQARTKWFSQSKAEPADATWRLPGGVVPGPAGDDTVYALNFLPESQEMPHEAKQLLSWYRERESVRATDTSADFAIFGTIGESLRWNLASADLREAMLGAIALMPGVTVTDSGKHAESTATLSMTSGAHRNEITIDTKTGLVIGTQQFDPLANRDGSSIYPKGTPTTSSTVSTMVVNSAP